MRATALLLCIAYLLAMLTACDGKPTNSTTTTADTTAITTTAGKFIGTTMTFAQGPQASATTTTTTRPTKPRPTEVNGVPVPKPAYDEGMVKLALQDEFDSLATFDFNGQNTPGKNWYVDCDMNASQPVVNKDYRIEKEKLGATGVLVSEPQTLQRTLFASYAKEIDKGYLWNFGYAEARIWFKAEDIEPSKGYGGRRQSWPSFWSRDVRDYDQASYKKDYDHSVELDMFEAWTMVDAQPEKGACYSGALHHFINKRISLTGKQQDISIGYAMGKINGKAETHRITTGWHTYGALWKKGYVAFYMDGKFMHGIQYGANMMPKCYIGDPNKPIDKTPDGFFEGIFNVLDNQEMVIILGGGDKYWPQYTDYVRIWEYES